MSHDTEIVAEVVFAWRGYRAEKATPSSKIVIWRTGSASFERVKPMDEAQQREEARDDPPYDPRKWKIAIRRDEPAEPVEPVKRTRVRKPTVASVIRQMKRAGFDIAGCEINPRDGTVKVITGKPVGGDLEIDDAAPVDRSEWN